MKRTNILIPTPQSHYHKVKCTQCQESTIVYSHSTRDIKCKSCQELLVQKTGGKSHILGEILETLD